MADKQPMSLMLECPTCGRVWFGQGGWIGFMWLPYENHVSACARRTPRERRAANRRDERRWARERQQRQRLQMGVDRWIRNNPNHPGVKDDDGGKV